MTEKEFLSSVINLVRLVIIPESKAIELIADYYRNNLPRSQETQAGAVIYGHSQNPERKIS